MKRVFILSDPAKIVDGQQFPRFRVTATKPQDSGWFMTVHEIDAIDYHTGQPIIDDEDDPYIVSCFIKWDGCSHFNFGDNYLHMCGQEGIADHMGLMCTVYELGYRLRGEAIPEWPTPIPAFTVQEAQLAEQAEAAL